MMEGQFTDRYAVEGQTQAQGATQVELSVDGGGISTPEFWITAIGMIVAALVPLLVVYNVFSREVAELWAGLVSAIAALVIPLVLSHVATVYNDGQIALKVAALELETARIRSGMY